ncbi:hypothetical protein QTJ16_004463 [Diplocarpon rosae]|uniref:Uncharacterized protein n=1 Tax=Diplocarpon rosae TaxID=946125 RepID=A0AAD9SZ04_9HELO|nr:hypothetical protein QTJ16_004463 [Diplocarpon rosae]
MHSPEARKLKRRDGELRGKIAPLRRSYKQATISMPWKTLRYHFSFSQTYWIDIRDSILDWIHTAAIDFVPSPLGTTRQPSTQHPEETEKPL